MHITIEETDEGFLLCLHLQPNETSSALRDFASSRPGPSRLPPRLSSTVRLTGLRLVEPAPPESLDVGLERRGLGPSRETIVPILDAAIAAHKPPVAGVIGALSRGIGNLLFGTGIDPRAGVSISEQLAELTDRSVAEVHTRLLAPFFGDPGIGPAFARGVTGDLRALAARGDVGALEEFSEFIEGVEARTQTFLASQRRPAAVVGDLAVGVGPGSRSVSAAGRGISVVRAARTLKVVKRLRSDTRTNLILARRIAGAP